MSILNVNKIQPVGSGQTLTINAANFDIDGGATISATKFIGELETTGTVTANSFIGDGSGLTNVVGSGAGTTIFDSGTLRGTATSINFTTNVDVSAIAAGILTVSVSDAPTFTGGVSVGAGATTAFFDVSTGRVGIGTDNPESPLHVVGTLNASPNKLGFHAGGYGGYGQITLVGNSGEGSFIDFSESGDSGDYKGRIIYFNSDDTFRFYTNGNNERLRITSSGNIGIGVTNPGTNLDVLRTSNDTGGIVVRNTNNSQGNARAQVEISGGDNADGRLKIECNGTEHTFRQDGSGNLQIHNASAERLRIDSTGKIASTYDGIASIAQYGQLEITKNGASDIDPNWSYLSFHRAGQIGWQQGIKDNDFVIAHTGGAARDTLDNERLRITNTGNVQIANGNLVFSTAGTGIDFSASADGSGTTSSELLDDYEEGTWTPIVTNLNGNPTFNASPNNTTGYYIKVGSKVTAWYYSSTFNVQTNGSGAAIISGFPFNSTNQTNSYAPGIMTHTNSFASDVENGYFSINNNYFVPTVNNSTASTTWTTGGTVYFMVSVTYWAA